MLGPRLNTLRLPPKESRYGKVWVGGIEEARGMTFRSVFVPGVNEGLFPRPPAEDPLLLESQRTALGIDLRPDDTELLRIAVACASERLTLLLLTPRSAHRTRARAVILRVRGASRRRRAGDRRASIRVSGAFGDGDEDRLAGAPDAADAIDDAEFDLATLAPRSPGSGQYLKRLPGSRG